MCRPVEYFSDFSDSGGKGGASGKEAITGAFIEFFICCTLAVTIDSPERQCAHIFKTFINNDEFRRKNADTDEQCSAFIGKRAYMRG